MAELDNKITVLIADDSEYMRSKLKRILTEEYGDYYDVVAEAAHGGDAVIAYKKHRPDVVMMDVIMPKCNGIKATWAINEKFDDANVVMCTSVGQQKRMMLAAEADAKEYVTKPFEPEHIHATIQKALQK